ncbi:MAG: hypothetical protein LBI65_01615 [Candidatus Symbiothrix sp.]|nr:hypothetical protein [Candidatus Symbiothrix sp.]
MDTLNRISLLPVDVVRFITMNFNRERSRYVYTGTKRLTITDEDKQQLLLPQTTDYRQQTINPDKRRHFERLHKQFQKDADGNPVEWPEITIYNGEEQKFEKVRPVSQYDHPHYTPDIHYTLNEKFINHNNRFAKGYRDVCIDALNELTGRYSRIFFAYLGGDKYDFHFSVEKLRELLNIEDAYKKRSSINLILECVKKEFLGIGLDFDYAWCTQAEWKAHTHLADHPEVELPAEYAEKIRKQKIFTKNFWFRVKGMDKYRIPKGVESVFSNDIAANPQYGYVKAYFNRELQISDKYIDVRWEYIKRYVKKWGAKALIDFAGRKMKQMATQKKQPRNAKAVLMSLIINAVKDLDKEGQGLPTAFSIPKDTDDKRYDPKGKSVGEIIKDLNEGLEHPPDSS